jgi:hypothetical protein
MYEEFTLKITYLSSRRRYNRGESFSHSAMETVTWLVKNLPKNERSPVCSAHGFA